MRPAVVGFRRTALVAASLAAGCRVGTAAAQEAVVPVRRVAMPDGGRYFALPVRVGSTTHEAAIDSGSTGLRILSPRLPPSDYRSLGQPSRIGFLSGTELDGFRAQADLGFGARHGVAEVQLIDRLTCGPSAPNCTEGHMPIRQTGLIGGSVRVRARGAQVVCHDGCR